MNNQTKEDLEATIASLQTKVSEIELAEHSAASRTPSPRASEEPKATAVDPIQQTVAALAASVPDGTYESPTPTRSGSKGNELEILQINARDAGIGNGTIYVYADVYNGTSDAYMFVNLSATCRDSAGNAVGTGVGIVQNLGPGETATATIIILSVPTCDRYSVRIDYAL